MHIHMCAHTYTCAHSDTHMHACDIIAWGTLVCTHRERGGEGERGRERERVRKRERGDLMSHCTLLFNL